MARSTWVLGDRIFALGAFAMIVGGLSLVVVSATLARTDQPIVEQGKEDLAFQFPSERCALPTGIELDALSASAADRLAAQAALCMDYEYGRMSMADYREGVSKLARVSLPPLADRLWASAIIESSSEYGPESWSAQQVLGPADVYPSAGDNTFAWASSEEDAKVEFIEVEVPAGRVSAVEVYETFNPGAISRIELVSSSGFRQRVYSATPAPMSAESHLRKIDLPCTEQDIVAVRVTLESAAVTGWNEIDAIAVKPCR